MGKGVVAAAAPARFSHFFITERLSTTISEPGTGYSTNSIDLGNKAQRTLLYSLLTFYVYFCQDKDNFFLLNLMVLLVKKENIVTEIFKKATT